LKTRCEKRVFTIFRLFSYQKLKKINFFVTKTGVPGSAALDLVGKIPYS